MSINGLADNSGLHHRFHLGCIERDIALLFTHSPAAGLLANRSRLLSRTILAGAALVKKSRFTEGGCHASFRTVEHKTLTDFVALAIPIKFTFQRNPAHVVLVAQLVLGTLGLTHLWPYTFSSVVLLFTDSLFCPSHLTVVV